MPTRIRHRLRLYRDPDVLRVVAVAAVACISTGGLLYLGYWVWVTWVAWRAQCWPSCVGDVLVFGKHAPHGRVDADFIARIERAAALWRRWRPQRLVLLGGGAPGQPSEAALARAGLLARGVPESHLLLESASRDTLQNMRNARDLLRELPPPASLALVSSRYHLARCLLFARLLGFDAAPCAAEPALHWSLRVFWHLAVEAAYVGLADIGVRWARLTGDRRMLARMT